MTVLRVKSLYATDFGSVSPGGIRSVIEVLARGAPKDVELTHVGIGPLDGNLPTMRDHYMGLGGRMKAGESVGVNATFVRLLLHNRDKLIDDADLFIVHRAEHVLVLPPGVPVLLLLHGGSWGAWRAKKGLFSLAYPILELLAAYRASAVLTVASGSHTRVMESFIRPKPITTAFDEQVFLPAKKERTGDLPPRLVAVARLVPEKRLGLVLETASALGVLTVDIFGEGPEREMLIQRGEELGLTLNLHGHVAPRKLAKWYEEHPAVFVLTSIFEGFPVSALEAASTGTPVVAIAAPGTRAAIPLMGGHLADSVSVLPSVIRRAWKDGNSFSAELIAERFGAFAISRRFWAEAQKAVYKGR